MNSNFLWFVGGGIVLGSYLKIHHIIKRMLEDRCTYGGCGCLKKTVTFYMEESPDASYGSHTGKCFDTYKFLRCREGHLRCHFRQRFVSKWTLKRRRKKHPEHFKWTSEIEALFHEAGLDLPGKMVASTKISPLHPTQMTSGFSSAHISDLRFAKAPKATVLSPRHLSLKRRSPK